MKFNSLNPKRFMVAGDTHGDMRHMQKLFKWADRHEVDVILQVGDFGYIWPNTEVAHKNNITGQRRYKSIGYPRGKTRLEKLDRMAANRGITILWLDGNHEDFDRMAKLGAYPHSEKPVELETGSVVYLPRGFAWSWGGIRFMTMGGAYSVDKDSRTHGVEWWPEETIKTPDVFAVEEEVIARGGIDILFSHDSPDIPAKLDAFLRKFGHSSHKDSKGDTKLGRASQSNRVALNTICELTDPRLLIHGHYHFPYYDVWHNGKTDRDMQVIGLDRNGSGVNSYFIFDIDEFNRNPRYYLEESNE